MGPAQSTYREGNATVNFALMESGGETIVNASTYDEIVQGESAPARKLLAELEGLEKAKNGTAYGSVLDKLRVSGEEKEPIHLRKRGGKARGGGLMRERVTGVQGEVYIRRGLHDLGF